MRISIFAVRPVIAIAGMVVLAGFCIAGTRARRSASEYRTWAPAEGGTIGAEVVPSSQVRTIFPGDLREYIVIETAFFPDPGTHADVALSDFILTSHAGDSIRAASPRAMVEDTRPGGQSPKLAIYPSVRVGIATESGPAGRRVWKSADAGVAVGPAVPDYPRTDPAAVLWELESRGLPEGISDQPMAGYLYFPYPAGKQKKAGFALKYLGPNGKQTVLAMK